MRSLLTCQRHANDQDINRPARGPESQLHRVALLTWARHSPSQIIIKLWIFEYQDFEFRDVLMEFFVRWASSRIPIQSQEEMCETIISLPEFLCHKFRKRNMLISPALSYQHQVHQWQSSIHYGLIQASQVVNNMVFQTNHWPLEANIRQLLN